MFKANSLVTNIDILSVIRLIVLFLFFFSSLPCEDSRVFWSSLRQGAGGSLASPGEPELAQCGFSEVVLPTPPHPPPLSPSSLASSHYFLFSLILPSSKSLVSSGDNTGQGKAQHLSFLHRRMFSPGVWQVSNLDLHVRAFFAKLRFLGILSVGLVDLHSFVRPLSRYWSQARHPVGTEL